jgi:hypothetical protein
MNKIELIPLAMTKVNWDSYVQVTKEVLNVNPSQAVVDSNINIDSPAAFAKSLTETFKSTNILGHIHLSFLGSLYEYTLLQVLNHVEAKIVSKLFGRDEVLFIITASVADWQSAVISGCQSCDDICIFFNQVYNFLIKAGFKNLFSGYSKQNCTDDYFRLIKK